MDEVEFDDRSHRVLFEELRNLWGEEFGNGPVMSRLNAPTALRVLARIEGNQRAAMAGWFSRRCPELREFIANAMAYLTASDTNWLMGGAE